MMKMVSAPARRPLSGLLAAVLLLGLLSPGCVATRVRRLPAVENGPSVVVSVYMTEKECREGRPVTGEVITELLHLDEGGPQLVHRESVSSWMLAGLVPGSYLVRVRSRVTEDGETSRPPRGNTEETFELTEGEQASIDIVLEKKPVALIVGLSIAAVVVAAAAVILFSDHDFHLPDPSAVMVDVAFHGAMTTCDAAVACAPPEGEFQARRDGVIADDGFFIIDHSPVHGTAGVTRQTDIRIHLSRGLNPEVPDHRAFSVRDGRGTRLLGGIYTMDAGRTCVFDPLHPLPPGETITVTIAGQGIRSIDDKPLDRDYSWSFTTADNPSPAFIRQRKPPSSETVAEPLA